MNSKGTSYTLSRVAIGLIWLYHGLVPKLIFRSVTELDLIQRGPIVGSPETTLFLAGIGEVVLAVCVFLFWRHTWPAVVSIAAFGLLLIAAMVMAPETATHAFNPVTLSGSGIFFGLINWCERSRYSSKTRVPKRSDRHPETA